jgi:hypothetical protein
MLKTRLTAEEFDALSDAEKAHYTKGSDSKGEGFFLQTEENTGLKRSLSTERTQKEQAVKLLKKAVPTLNDENREEWEELVTTHAEHAKELADAGIDLDEWKTYKDGKTGDKGRDGKGGKGEEVAEQLLEAQRQVRELTRQNGLLETAKTKAEAKATKLAADNDGLVTKGALATALDIAKVTDPQDRRVISALWKDDGLILRETGAGETLKRELFIKVDGQEVPLEEYAKDFPTTPMGKQYVKAPDNSGGGDGGPRQPPKLQPTELETLRTTNPEAALGSILAQKMPAAAA